MKNTKVIVILIVILLLHGLVFALVLGGCSKKDKESDVNQNPAAGGPAAGADANVSAEDAKAAVMEKIRSPYRYDNCARNTVPGLRNAQPGTAGIIVDLETRKVLWCKNEQKAVPIASMTKLMTMLIVYEMVLDPSSGFTLDTPVKVTNAAAKIGGSQVWLDPRETFTVRELMLATAVKSANDAAYLLAEFFGRGDVSAFVEKMNAKAAELGMKHTKFRNPHGLPGKTSAQDNVSSPEDMVRLAEATLLHPQLMEWTSTWRTPFRKQGTKGYLLLQNTNHLIPGGRNATPGVDGLKTGYINRSGYCLTVSCKRGNRRVIAVVMGHRTWKDRDRFVKDLLEWGYAKIAKE